MTSGFTTWMGDQAELQCRLLVEVFLMFWGPDSLCVFPVIPYVLEMKREYFSVDIVIVQKA